MSVLALGTAQFGMDYGINNTRGRIRENEVAVILAYAADHGIRLLDTAAAYGGSEDVLGTLLERAPFSFSIVTKISAGTSDAVGVSFERSIRRLRAKTLYGCLFHDLELFRRNPSVWQELVRFRERGMVKRIGFSLYTPEEWRFIEASGVEPDLIQLPLNVFDRRFAKEIPLMRRRGIEVHVRSVFLQGLAFRDPETLPVFFNPMRDAVRTLQRVAVEIGSTPAAVCLAFAVGIGADYTVVGVDSLEHLQQLLAFEQAAPGLAAAIPMLEGCVVDDPDMILPYRWPVRTAR
jgi:aryl-alcohol dehydrogenase-like predicted oxidoreductase